MRKRRWSDNDHHFWPFTLSVGDYPRYGIMLDSGADVHPGCHIRFAAFRCTLIMELPPIIRPWRERIVATTWDAATVERMGRNWYFNEHARECGFSFVEGALHVHYGAQTHDSTTDRVKVFFLPWRNWRFVRHSLYGLDGEHFWTQADRKDWEANFAAKDACPSVSFEFDDFDGERITAKTRIEEREWRFGEGYFKWLSLFRKPRISRTLDIDFSKETGRRKGSWKGGTVGHSIDLRPGELHEPAFRRYCAKHDMTFVGPA